MKYKVLVTSRSFGKAENRSVEILKKANIQVDYTDANSFEAKIPNYDALIIGAHNFSPELMNLCSKLKVICKHGAELDNIPLDKAKEMGIKVFNVPGVNTERVADLTFGLLLDISRQISYTNKIVHLGKWQTAIGSDITGKTLGILGLGAIGKSVAQRATGFKMNIIAFDPYISNSKLEKEFEYISLCSLDSVLQESDFLSIHVPLTEETKNLLSEKNLLKMKKGSYIINTAKGEVIDENALYKLLKSGHLSGAAMDVCTIEPIPPFHPLLELDNVVITPHIGVYTKEAISEVSLTCAKYIVETLTHINL